MEKLSLNYNYTQILHHLNSV